MVAIVDEYKTRFACLIKTAPSPILSTGRTSRLVLFVTLPRIQPSAVLGEQYLRRKGFRCDKRSAAADGDRKTEEHEEAHGVKQTYQSPSLRRSGISVH